MSLKGGVHTVALYSEDAVGPQCHHLSQQRGLSLSSQPVTCLTLHSGVLRSPSVTSSGTQEPLRGSRVNLVDQESADQLLGPQGALQGPS
jgi:hypothetical protein